ncbi:hypothetical protein A1O1_07673 [Capronia coronata CBS 617.96]|uniref:polynucleotide adenylyltransferase n=1 Tax=Capronia coronata CBS 617.96 TaxID=1182541 RepID=W9XN07_9EURO|nr:uncharacterized protein A1O1_07673 [Capronia coronata CBS 617.96]EXJ81608.1 hypothetical protein A1O1_07673 [Capronia coronata CBS 617.96]
MAAPQNPPGFSPHVWDQLQQSSNQVAQQNRGNRRGRGQSRGPASSSYQHRPQQRRYAAQNEVASFQNQQVAPQPSSEEMFPPLGTNRLPALNNVSLPTQYQPPTYSQQFHDTRHGTPREYQDRARGGLRGRSGHFGTQQHLYPAAQNINQQQYSTYGRPPHRNGNLFNPNGGMGYGSAEQQRNMRQLIMKQSDYLNSVGRKAHAVHQLSREESLAKENFRRELEQVARDALKAKYPDFDIQNVRLKCYGSLANGFALAGCDMDLLLSLPSWSRQRDPATVSAQTDPQQESAFDEEDEERAFNMEIRRVLEKAYLDEGYGARLLTNTRVPILRICQSPSSDLLKNLRENRAAWEKSSFETPAADVSPSPADGQEIPADVDSVEQALADLKVDNTAPRPSTPRGNTGLEFTGDCGIQCDINFTNFVALHNSALLKLYHGFDQRVADIGVFVKIWAKTRDINTPYRGTLSSYGYILMVLHYLMNVASPPIIPNLQHLAKVEDDWNPGKKIELFEGFDVRFLQDPKDIDQLRRDMSANKNHESAGQLLRGFFRYYGTREGFHWTRDVISIRHKGGILSKQEKGWTEAKWAQKGDNNVRLRYLLAIEDPFEVDHNIARTVGHHGLVAIRDEFRRAWSIMERIGAGETVSIDEFLEPVTDRADTLRKDLEFHRQKQKLMKLELEAKEKNLLDQAKTLGTENPDSHTDGTSGISDHANLHSGSSMRIRNRSPSSMLTSTTSYQGKNKRQPSKSWRHRKVEADSDDEHGHVGDDATSCEPHRGMEKDTNLEEDVSVTLGQQQQTPKPSGGLCSPSEVLLANGFDHFGNPVAWDMTTQDGRWLQWRDNKIKQGTYRQFTNPTMRELDDQCPFDPDRPIPHIDNPYTNRFEQLQMERPPWPANGSNISIVSKPAPKQDTESSVKVVSLSGSSGSSEDGVVPSSPQNIQPKLPQNYSVGEKIDWDSATRGGRFLLYRDSRIRRGAWEYHRRSKFTELDNAFPYDPDMWRDELGRKNELLRTYYMYTLSRKRICPDLALDDAITEPSILSDGARVPELSMTQSATAYSEDVSFQDEASTRHANSVHGIRAAPDLPIVQDGQSFAAPVLGSYETDAASPATAVLRKPGMTDAEFIRQQRLAFFTRPASASGSDAGTNSRFYQQSNDEEPDTMDDGPALVPVQPSELNRQPPAREQLNIESPRHNEPSLVQREDEEGSQSPDSGPLKEEQSNVDQQTVTDVAPLKVPATLYPGVDSSQRPRDEDPQIMPIPRDFGFQFDLRQLRDLDVIAQGGNGCAREGAEFTIEDEYEWGGGGMMGWKDGTSPEPTRSSFDDTPYKVGDGDLEGLLDELPGDLD